MRTPLVAVALALAAGPAAAQYLLVGLEGTGSPVRSSDLAGFPDLTWSTHNAQDINGAAATPGGAVYICTGFFTTELYRYTLGGPAQHLCTTSVAIHGLGFGNGTLYGFANYATPMGIYSIDTATGACTLVVDTSAQGYRYFALDFNPADGLLYGYTEYGSPGGLHAIDPATGAITPVAGPFPADNSMGRALAAGNDTVYVCATQGAGGVGLYAWNLGTGGPWTPFTQPYPDQSANGGAAWVPLPTPSCEVAPTALDFGEVAPGVAVTQTFTIRNAGGGTLSGTVSEACPDFSILAGAAYSLGEGESQTVTVRFQAAQTGAFSCELDAGGDCPPVACAAVVTATPACAVDPLFLDFGEMPPGTAAAMSFTITNEGGTPLSGTVGAGTAGFTVDSGATYDLAPGESQTVVVAFTAGLPGQFACMLDVGGACPDVACAATVPVAGDLFVGLEEAALAPVSSDLTGFPDLSWNPHAPLEVAGAAATPEGELFVCSGAFSTQLFRYPLDGQPEFLCATSVALHGLGCVDGTLYGFANFATPMGIYEVDPASGQCAPAVDLSTPGFRFFALDGSAEDGLLYGYTEYGSPAGLYSIQPESGEVTFIAGPIPAANSSGRALAAGAGHVFLLATRGDEGVPAYAWDLAAGGPWEPFTQPFPNHHSSGGAAWVARPAPQCVVSPLALDFGATLPGRPIQRTFTITNAGQGTLTGTVSSPCPELAVVAGAFYSLGAGENHVVTVRFQSELPGAAACALDPGAGCEPLPCTAAVVAPAVVTGPASACGAVEDLGHLPGALTGFVPDWEAGLVGLALPGLDGRQVTVAIHIDDTVIWSGPVAAAAWEARESTLELFPWYDQDVALWFSVAAGGHAWNATGEDCDWVLAFSDLGADRRPGAFNLGAAPNPFNPRTTLRLETPAAGDLRLSVHDLAGREMAVLHDGPVAAGSHAFTVDGTAWASGLYLVQARVQARAEARMEAGRGDRLLVRKILLAK